MLFTPALASNAIVRHPGDLIDYLGDQAYAQMTVFGGTGPYSWSATGLPPGLAINAATGVVTGRVTGAGTHNVTATATAAGGSGSAAFVWQTRRDVCPTC